MELLNWNIFQIRVEFFPKSGNLRESSSNFQTMRVTDWSGFVDFVDRVQPARLDFRRLPYVKVRHLLRNAAIFQKLIKV